MIPDHLIDKAVRAASEGWVQHEQYQRDRTRKQVTAALEAVAADIWDEGADAGETVGYGIARDNWAPRITNPYRASETE